MTAVFFGDDEVEWEHEAGGSDENQNRGVRSFIAPHPTDAKDAPVEWGIRGLGWLRKKRKRGGRFAIRLSRLLCLLELFSLNILV
jgi:hypothetical protein